MYAMPRGKWLAALCLVPFAIFFIVFQIAPLAPSPEVGHVEVEPAPHPDAAPPSVGG